MDDTHFAAMALLGVLPRNPLRTVGGADWLHHMALATVSNGRGETSRAWLHCRSAALSFVASLQQLGSKGITDWFRLGEDDVHQAVVNRVPGNVAEIGASTAKAVRAFVAELSEVMAETFSDLSPLKGSQDLSMLANTYVRTAAEMPEGKGARFVRNTQSGNTVGVEVRNHYGRTDPAAPMRTAVAYYRNRLLEDGVSKRERVAMEKSVALIAKSAVERRDRALCLEIKDLISAMPWVSTPSADTAPQMRVSFSR